MSHVKYCYTFLAQFFICHGLIIVTFVCFRFVCIYYEFNPYSVICLNLLSLWLDASDILSNFIVLKKFLLLQTGMIVLHKSSPAIILASPFIIFLGISFASHLCRIPCFLDSIFFLFLSLLFHFLWNTSQEKGA